MGIENWELNIGQIRFLPDHDLVHILLLQDTSCEAAVATLCRRSAGEVRISFPNHSSFRAYRMAASMLMDQPSISGSRAAAPRTSRAESRLPDEMPSLIVTAPNECRMAPAAPTRRSARFASPLLAAKSPYCSRASATPRRFPRSRKEMSACERMR